MNQNQLELCGCERIAFIELYFSASCDIQNARRKILWKDIGLLVKICKIKMLRSSARDIEIIIRCHHNMGVSENSGTPKSSILIGFSIINHPFWGTPIFGNTHISQSWQHWWWWPKPGGTSACVEFLGPFGGHVTRVHHGRPTWIFHLEMLEMLWHVDTPEGWSSGRDQAGQSLLPMVAGLPQLLGWKKKWHWENGQKVVLNGQVVDLVLKFIVFV